MAALPHVPLPSEPRKSPGWFLRLARQREWFHAALIDPGRSERSGRPKATRPKPEPEDIER